MIDSFSRRTEGPLKNPHPEGFWTYLKDRAPFVKTVAKAEWNDDPLGIPLYSCYSSSFPALSCKKLVFWIPNLEMWKAPHSKSRRSADCQYIQAQLNPIPALPSRGALPGPWLSPGLQQVTRVAGWQGLWASLCLPRCQELEVTMLLSG